MYYYEVWLRSNRYHGNTPLTYQSPEQLSLGQIVSVPMQKERVAGFISARVTKPNFATKPISTILALPPLPPQLLAMASWLNRYYPAPLGLIAGQCLPAMRPTETIPEQPSFDAYKTDLPRLTREQVRTIEQVKSPNTYLLHGKTGSGKTRVYIELTRNTIDAGRSALILTPEISLTSQLAHRYRAVFGNRVIVMHSQLTPAQRRDAWLNMLSSREPRIIIGPRSILFSPLSDIGLIVLDEAHEPAYKQEQAPHYHASRVAAMLRELHGAQLVLGSATPSVQDYFVATERDKPIITMEQLAIDSDHKARTEFIDLKDRSLFTRSQYLSTPLITAVQRAIDAGEQSLLYLNRRGTARIVICESCGWQAACPHCDIPLTYHGDTHELRCHICNIKQQPPVICPDCKQPRVIYKTIGTKAVVEEVTKLFPGARIKRFDTDNSKAERFEQHYEALQNGDVDIIIGTQLLAKGVDLPKLSVLGVLLADTSLQMPDFTASERTYQLLSQVLGRVGRGHRDSRAFIQTYQPTNPTLLAAAHNSWDEFYAQEIKDRKAYKFPPFYHLLKLSVRRASPKSAEQAAQKLADQLEKIEHIIIEGPAPALHQKVAGKYQYQVIVKSVERSALLRCIEQLPSNWSYDIDPVDLF